MSTAWTVQKLSESLKKKELHPLYFFFGDERFLLDENLKQLEEIALGEGLRDFNLNTFYGQEADAGQVRDAAETLPMMSQVRLVVLKEAQELKDKEWEQLMPLIETPVESTVFICVADKVDRRKKFIKRFMDKGVVVEFKRPFENQIPDFIAMIAKKHGLKIGDEALSVMHSLTGSNLSDINNEMLKLSQYLGERKTVTAEDVLAIVSRLKVDSVFDLTDAIGRNDRAKALYCLANLLDHGQNEIGVLALVSRHVRILKQIQEGIKEGLSGQRLSSKAGVPPFFLKNYLDQSRQWTGSKVERTFQTLLDTDRALKSSPLASHIWLENFILQTCSG